MFVSHVPDFALKANTQFKLKLCTLSIYKDLYNSYKSVVTLDFFIIKVLILSWQRLILVFLSEQHRWPENTLEPDSDRVFLCEQEGHSEPGEARSSAQSLSV